MGGQWLYVKLSTVLPGVLVSTTCFSLKLVGTECAGERGAALSLKNLLCLLHRLYFLPSCVQVSESQRWALMEFITHLSTYDWEAVALDLQLLGFIPQGVSTKGWTAGCRKQKLLRHCCWDSYHKGMRRTVPVENVLGKARVALRRCCRTAYHKG